MAFSSHPKFNNRLWTCATGQTRFWDVDQQDDELVGSGLQYGQEDIVQTALCVAFDIHGDAITGTKSGDVYFYRKNRLHKVERGQVRPRQCLHGLTQCIHVSFSECCLMPLARPAPRALHLRRGLGPAGGRRRAGALHRGQRRGDPGDRSAQACLHAPLSFRS
jgi:hypothetical protein